MTTMSGLARIAGRLLAACICMAISPAAPAGTCVWIQPASGNWGDSNNWSGGIVAEGSNSSADFSAVDMADDLTVHLDAPRTIGSVVFGDAGTNSPASWTLDDNAVPANVLTLSAASGSAMITVTTNMATGRSATISAPVNLASVNTEFRVRGADNYLFFPGDITTSVGSGTIMALTMFGPGTCVFSGSFYAPADRCYKQVKMAGGIAKFTNVRIDSTTFTVGYGTSTNTYVSLLNPTITVDPAGQWWGVFDVGGSDYLSSCMVSGGTIRVVGNTFQLLGWTGKGKAIAMLDGNVQVSASDLWMGETDYTYAVLVIRDATLAFDGGVQAGGSKGAGIINQAGGTVSGSAVGLQYRMSQSSSWGIYNLLGGVLTCSEIHSGDGGTGFIRNNTYFNFHGGTLRAGNSNTDFIRTTITGPNAGIAAPRANVYAGGAVIDTAGFDVGINQPLAAPPGMGVTNGTILLPPASQGSGYKGAPVISVVNSGGDTNGTAATAVANMADDGSGKGTFKIESIHITNPGINYSNPPVLTVTGGDPAVAMTLPPLGIATNDSGGLTKKGLGKLSLMAFNTYTGDTAVVEGALEITQPYLADNSDMYVSAGAGLVLSFIGIDRIGALYHDGVAQPQGLYGAGALDGAISGTGYLKVTKGPPGNGSYLLVK